MCYVIKLMGGTILSFTLDTHQTGRAAEGDDGSSRTCSEEATLNSGALLWALLQVPAILSLGAN